MQVNFPRKSPWLAGHTEQRCSEHPPHKALGLLSRIRQSAGVCEALSEGPGLTAPEQC